MSKIVKLLALVAVATLIALPTIVCAQEGTDYTAKEEVYKPNASDPVWSAPKTVTKTFDIDGVSKTFTFSLNRTVSKDGPTKEYYIYPQAEMGTHYTWEEIATATPGEVSMGKFTVRATGKVYKAIPPVEMEKKIKEPGKGWKRGVTVVRSK